MFVVIFIGGYYLCRALATRLERAQLAFSELVASKVSNSGTSNNPAAGANVPAPTTALVIQCQWDFLPIAIPAAHDALILFLKQKPEWERYSAAADSIFYWPRNRDIESILNVPRTIYKCSLASLNQPVEDVSIPLDVHLGNIPHPVILNVSFLDKENFNFYIVNQCPVVTSIIIPNKAALKLLDESVQREVVLRGADSNSIGKILMLLPLGIKWHSNPVCD
jgi:hypothetical protein